MIHNQALSVPRDVIICMYPLISKSAMGNINCTSVVIRGVIPYKINRFSKILPHDHLGFSSFLDMLVHVIKELHMQNYRSVPQTVPEIWLI